jgi:hypothetical protein
MPQQEIFLDERTRDGRQLQVIKTYDEKYAKEAFRGVDVEAREHLWKALDVDNSYDTDDLPLAGGTDWDDLLLDELISAGREDFNLSSYFIVLETKAAFTKPVYVSADWPSAEQFARTLEAAS